MTTITKERIELFIKNPLDNGLTRGEQMELARIALASLEAEPVAVNDDMAYAFHHALSDSSLGADEVEEIKTGLRAAFANVTTQPAPVVPDDWQLVPKKITLEMECALSKADSYEIGWLWALAAAPKYEVQNAKRVQNALNSCRAAMLHGAEPVSQTYKLNELAGNSPVIPDGWISCSERMPEDTKMLLAFSQGEIVAAYWNWVVNPIDYKKYRAFTYLSGNILDDVTHWMPLPEPPL
ncbi:TPA: DUF551 domain-containing protein [Escherichia coli]|nr:DUF551 domain-containing protein [Escherichia coli]HCN3525718.1 DUF551 domain-containing protein [Escherichia coli]